MALAALTLSLLAVPASVSAAPAQVWYVADGGSNDDDCLSASPCATLDHVTPLVQPGDTVYLGAGVYPLGDAKFDVGGVTFEHIGSGEATITLPGDSYGIEVSADDVTFRNLTVSSSDDTIQGDTWAFTYTASGLRLDHMRVGHVASGVIGIGGVNGVTVTDSTFTDIGGSAIDVEAGLTVATGNDFTAGGGIHVKEQATVEATGNVFRGNTAGDGGTGLYVDGRDPADRPAGTATGNRFMPNLEAGIFGGLPIQAANNWWGCNEGIENSDCVANYDLPVENAEPHLVLNLSASPNPFLISSFSTVTASLISSDPEAAYAGGPMGTDITLSTDEGTLDDTQLTLDAGHAQTSLRNTVAGSSTVLAILDNASAESLVEARLTIALAQSITFTSTAPTSAVVGGSYTPTATGGASGNAVSFTVDDATAEVCTIDGGTFSFTGAGTCTVNADQAGDANYAAAAQVHQTFTVASADFTTVDIAIGGTAQVGHAVTADVNVTPGADLAYVWKADNGVIPGTTDSDLDLTPDLAGTDVTVTVTATRDGYNTATVTSDEVTVANGTQTGTLPTITGIPVVDGILTATPGETMAGAELSYQWSADGEAIFDATGVTLALTPALVGKVITVTTTAALAGYDDLDRTSVATTAVAKAALVAPAVSVTGTMKAGQTLTATASSTPAATVAWQWTRGGSVVGTQAAYTLTDDDENRVLTVTAVLTLAGYDDATASATTATIATRKAPSITLDADRTKLRLGQNTTVTWTTERATTVTGDWTTTALAADGTATLKPNATGLRSYTLTATNVNGTTTASVALDVALPRATFQVTAARKVKGGKKYVVRVKGLAAREKFTVSQGTQRVSGTASIQGSAAVRLTSPRRNEATTVTVKVTGSLSDRTGQTRVAVKPRPIRLTLAHAQVRASGTQVVTVTHLASGEKVTIRYRGKVVAIRRATSRGTLTYRLDARAAWGTHTVRVRAHRTHRLAHATFDVVRRCADGVTRCA